jgi:hypothetical protein
MASVCIDDLSEDWEHRTTVISGGHKGDIVFEIPEADEDKDEEHPPKVQGTPHKVLHETQPPPKNNIEEEVYKLSKFDKNKCYVTGEYTRAEGNYPNKKYYINTNNLKYVGKYVNEISSGYSDQYTITYYFENNGITNTVTLNYAGTTCFKEVQCTSKLGGKRHRKNKKTKKQKNKKTKRRRTRRH